LPIRDGYNVLDDNLLACSADHLDAVLVMLARQPERPKFTGGLEAARLTQDIADRLIALRPDALYFAYDDPADLDYLIRARAMLAQAGAAPRRHYLHAYVLCGYKHDTMTAAEARMHQVLAAGYFPMAMLYRGRSGATDPDWRKFQRRWARPAIIAGAEMRP
jgi:hypothetical protein